MDTATPNTPEAPGASGAAGLAQLAALVARVEQGDRHRLPELRQWLDANPQVWEAYGDLGQMTAETMIHTLTGDESPLGVEILFGEMRRMSETVAGERPSPIERLLAERVALCWLHVHVLELRCAEQQEGQSLHEAASLQKLLTAAHRRYLAALKTLAQVQRLRLPAVQVNIAEQQVNVAGEACPREQLAADDEPPEAAVLSPEQQQRLDALLARFRQNIDTGPR